MVTRATGGKATDVSTLHEPVTWTPRRSPYGNRDLATG